MNEITRILEVYNQIDFSQRKAALATVVRVEGSSYRRPGARMLITDDGRWEGAISGGCLEGDALHKARQVMRDGQPIVVTYDTMDDEANSFGVGLGCNGIIDVFIEPLDPAGYDVIPVVRLARELGWQVTVTDDCIAHLSPKRFPVATCVLHADRSVVLDQLTITERTAAVLMSHNFHYNRAVLQALLATDVPYIGMLGPRKRFEKMQAKFEGDGFSATQAGLDRVHAPIGLDIGAETPDGIALSIIGEIKAFFTHRPGGVPRICPARFTSVGRYQSPPGSPASRS